MYNKFLTSSSSSSISSDEESIPKRPHLIPERRNPFADYDNVDFKKSFRLSKQCAEEIIKLIGHKLEHLSNRNFPVSPMNQLLVTLKFYATGSLQMCTGDPFNVSKATVSRIIKRVTHEIASLRPRFAHLPQSRNELIKTQNDFHAIRGFPGVLGAISCTHVRIQSPGGDNAELFRNRKGWFSISVQVVCDAELKIKDIVARHPGSVPNSSIFNGSRLRARLEKNEYPDTYLLGDSGYACRKYLLTPVPNPQTPSESAYNDAHVQTRNTVERTFDLLKRRFPCLSLGMRVNIDTTLAIIVATAVLHNIAITMKDNVPNEDPEIVIPVSDDPNLGNNNEAIRTALINTTFAR